MKGCPKQRWLIRLFNKLLLWVKITMTENIKKKLNHLKKMGFLKVVKNLTSKNSYFNGIIKCNKISL